VEGLKRCAPEAIVEDAVFGNHAALACHNANESYFRKVCSLTRRQEYQV